jgi:hypothetical protein
MRHATRLPAVTLFLIGTAACGGDRKAADEAIARADRFVAAMRTEASKVLPEAVKRLEDSLQQAKDQAAAGDHRAARAIATGVAGGAIEVARSVGPKRTEFDSIYKVISFEVTEPVRKTVARARQLSGGGRLPPGVSRVTFDSLRAEIAGWEGAWKTVTEHYYKGEIGPAATKAMALRKSVFDAMKLLGLSPRK